MPELYRATSVQEYNSLYQIISDNLCNESEREQLYDFNELSSKCCMSKIPYSFIGTSCSTASAEKINDLVKTKIKTSLCFYDCIYEVFKITCLINENSYRSIKSKFKLEGMAF